MNRIKWSIKAETDLAMIFSFLAEQSEKYALETIIAIDEKTQQLIDFPLSGQAQIFSRKKNKEYRYLVSGHYKIFYRLNGKTIYIVAVFDTRQHPKKLSLRLFK